MEVSIPPATAPGKNEKIDYATEIAFNALREQAQKNGLDPQPVMGLMYLPNEADTRAFQLGCRAALASMGVIFDDPAREG